MIFASMLTRARKRPLSLSGLTAAGCAALIAVAVAREFYPPPLAATQSITVSATPIDFDPSEPDHVHFGRMRWLGGLVLKSDCPYFGGYSGLSLDAAGGRLFAISDTGTWLSAELALRDGRLAGLADAQAGPILDQDGKPLRGKSNQDAEGLAVLTPGAGDGSYLISFEHEHRVVRYRFADGALKAEGAVTIPDAVRRLPANEGLEGLTVLRAGPRQGAILTFAENKRARDDEILGWLIKDGESSELRLKAPDRFSVTDLASLANGDVLVLQRRFINPFDGIHMRLARIAAADIKPGALIEPELLLQADGRLNIDNMEGLAVVERPGGGLIVTMISDDNFNPLQRTVLLQFALEGAARGE